MRRMLAALFGAAILLAAPAGAQDVAQSAAAFIAENGAVGVFEPASAEASGAMRVRHVGSGMVCAFDPQAPHRIVLFAGLARGEDVACDFRLDDAFVTLYATRYPEPTSNADQLAGAIAQIRQRFSDAQLAPADFATDIAPAQGALPDSVHAAFLVSAPDAAPDLFTRVSVAMVEGWAIKMRFSRRVADEADARESARAAAMVWLRTLQDLSAAPAAADAEDAAGP